ncbi:MAG: hypothetical protein ACK2TU_05045 [Anaerolineales bacterium]
MIASNILFRKPYFTLREVSRLRASHSHHLLLTSITNYGIILGSIKSNKSYDGNEYAWIILSANLETVRARTGNQVENPS